MEVWEALPVEQKGWRVKIVEGDVTGKTASSICVRGWFLRLLCTVEVLVQPSTILKLRTRSRKMATQVDENDHRTGGLGGPLGNLDLLLDFLRAGGFFLFLEPPDRVLRREVLGT